MGKWERERRRCLNEAQDNVTSAHVLAPKLTLMLKTFNRNTVRRCYLLYPIFNCSSQHAACGLELCVWFTIWYWTSISAKQFEYKLVSCCSWLVRDCWMLGYCANFTLENVLQTSNSALNSTNVMPILTPELRMDKCSTWRAWSLMSSIASPDDPANEAGHFPTTSGAQIAW